MAPPKADYGCPPLCSPVAGVAATAAADKTKWELKSGGIGKEEEEGSVLFVWTAAGLGLKRRNGGFSTFYVHRPAAPVLLLWSNGIPPLAPVQAPPAHNRNGGRAAELFQCNRQLSDVVTAPSLCI